MSRFLLVLLVVALLPARAEARNVHASCEFRSRVWWIVEDASRNLNNAILYADTDQVDRTRENRSQAYARLAARYGFPHGYWSLSVALNRVWAHVWNYVYWHNLWDADLRGDGNYDADQKKMHRERSAGWRAVSAAWKAA